MRGLTIVGTDTSVGKTTVGCSLLRVLLHRGWKPIPYKPVETGVSSDKSDSRALLNSAGTVSLSEAEISQFRFPDPVAPALAAKWAGIEITKESLLTAATDLEKLGNFLVVETAGGPLTPFSNSFSSLDLAATLGFPILLVSKNGLGTISHTALAVREIRSRGLSIFGVVLSTISKEPSPDQPFNAALIESATGIRPLGVFPYLENESSSCLLSAGLKVFSEEKLPCFPNEPRYQLVEEK